MHTLIQLPLGLLTRHCVAGAEKWPKARTDCGHRNEASFLGKGIHDLGLILSVLYTCIKYYYGLNRILLSAIGCGYLQ